MAKSIVYIPMCADIVHPGHLNVIRAGQEYGEVVIGLLTDEAVSSKKRVPLMNYDQRYAVVSSIKGVSRVIPQQSPDYRPNLKKLKPAFVIHGGPIGEARPNGRQEVLDTISEWGGKLVEVGYTEGISSTQILEKMKHRGVSPTERQAKLGRILESGQLVRALEAHDGLSAMIVERTTVKKSKTEEFEAIWISSLTDSLSKGKPDNEVVDRTSRLSTVNEILDVTTKPIIVDGDTGGQLEHFCQTVKTLERLGVSAVVIEDKTGLKQNSLHDRTEDHVQEDPVIFGEKIRAGLDSRAGDQFMVIARIESLILGHGQDDALARAKLYLQAGASAIMIHSKLPSGRDIRAFAKAYNKLDSRAPLMAVPTSYDKITEAELKEWGVNIVVYANQLLRASYPSMTEVARLILEHHRAFEADKHMSPIKELLDLFKEPLDHGPA